MVDGNLFAHIDSASHIEIEWAARGESAGLASDAALGVASLDFFRTVGAKSQFQGFSDMYSQARGQVSRPMSFDVTQNPAKRARGNAWIPAITRSTSMCLLEEDIGNPGESGPVYFSTQQELRFAQGWPKGVTLLTKKYVQYMSFDLSALA